ncbi:kinase-like domain-containing protein [Rhizophagus irregularis DAOM 181602=DAOM 197198]|nr:kinase-like domain-containing protein [Rhizophagus irregularis DAOM 181602=DAOM 197198]
MEQPTNYKNKIDFSLSNNTSLIQPTQSIVKSKYKKSKCPECNKRRKPLDESHQICHVCYNVKVAYKYGSSGNRIIDDFIRYTQINLVNKRGKMEYVPYEQFINIKFIAEGGFIVLKKINDSKNITSKELNELKVFYDIYKKSYGIFIGRYFGVTQDPNSQDIMIIMPYYDSECWHSDPEKRPVAADLHEKIRNMHLNETENFQKNNPTGIIESLDIGPATTNNPGAIYKSRPLSSMINSAMSLRSSRSQSISLEKLKRKFEDNLIENNDEGRSIKKEKLYENEDYFTEEINLDIDINFNNNEYISKENDFDIDTQNL